MAKITGVDEAMQWLEDEVVVEMNTMTTNIFLDAQANTPIGETGNLKRSWVLNTASDPKEEAYVENTAHYAGYVEYGTHEMAPRAMMTNAIEKELNRK